MKPHIWKWLGVYHCGLPIERGLATYATGLGYTPKQAYNDWLLRRVARTSEAAGLEAT